MFKSTLYKERRENLKKFFKHGVLLFLGNQDSPANYPSNCYKFRQDSSFLYFFGINEPCFAGLIDIDNDKEIIFGNDVDMDDIIWMGNQPTVVDRAALAGITETYPLEELSSYLHRVQQQSKVHYLPPYRTANCLMISEILHINAKEVIAKRSLELINAVVALRSTKGKEEIEELEKASYIGYKMHTAAMQFCKLGVKEQEIAGILDGIAASYGKMNSFETILSQNGETLHNHYHNQIITDGRLLLTDAGAENNMNYCSDHTRTIPTGGKFTQRQKEVYSIVLNCHDKAVELAKPNVTYLSVHLDICKQLVEGLKGLGLMKGDTEEAVAAGAHALFMPHGLGHMMGLDVHDMEDFGQIHVGYDQETRPSNLFGTSSLRMGRRLEEGFVVTDEPGCYFIPALIDKWRAEKMHTNFLCYDTIETYKDFGGIRLEDDLLITSNGARFIGEKHIPITIEEVENYMQDYK
ncbi:MAG: aminopeptidase P family protein [Bacteroidaceae bacterium]|nr:aminopeptidase P family protein [Bacteroidaceae bacterium]